MGRWLQWFRGDAPASGSCCACWAYFPMGLGVTGAHVTPVQRGLEQVIANELVQRWLIGDSLILF